LVNEVNKDGENSLYRLCCNGAFTNYFLKKMRMRLYFQLTKLALYSCFRELFYFKKTSLCSNTTSLPEIAGDALYFDPANPADIAKTIIFFFITTPHINRYWC
jgi:hypothetical protein